MPEILNGSFETAGATDGEAQSWTVTISTALGAVMAFTGASEPNFSNVLVDTRISIEQFDYGWGTDGYLLDPADGDAGPFMIFDAGTFTPTDTEQFDNWNNGKPYMFDVNTGISMEFAPDVPGQALSLEQFDEGWNTADWTAEPAEDVVFEDSFDTGWSTDTWAEDVTSGTEAMFDGGASDTESFENAWPDMLFFADAESNECTAPTMPSFGPPPDGFPVTILTTGGYPGGLIENRTYYLKNVSAFGGGFTFELSLTNGGATVNITSAGDGSHYLHADPAQFWTRFEE